MNLADKITFIRIILAPIFFVVFYILKITAGLELQLLLLLWILFIVMELSDLFDGMVARKMNQSSDLGKLLDPFADVISRMTYFFCFIVVDIMPFWIYMILLYREFSISFIRMNLTRRKIVMGAKWSGKIKAWVYAAGGVWGLIYISCQRFLTNLFKADIFSITSLIVFGVCALIALVSLTDYFRFFIKNMELSKKGS